jgi:hypothetical protein
LSARLLTIGAIVHGHMIPMKKKGASKFSPTNAGLRA